MSVESKKIRIETVNGGDARQQNALKRNYFQATGVNDTYLFYSSNNEVIRTTPPVLANGRNFSFELKEMPEVTWTVTNFLITDKDATGNWMNDHRVENDDGTFTAQAGPAFEETVSSATA